MATTPPATTTVGETKAQKFTRLGVSRVEKALTSISMIGGLANKANYEYTDTQVNEIEGALKAELDVLMKRFRSPQSVTAAGFKFGS